MRSPGCSIFLYTIMNLELVRLIKYEMTVDFLGDFRAMIISSAKEQELDTTSLDIIVAILDQLYALPDKELSGWFCDKDGIGWKTIFNAMTSCATNYIRMRHIADGEWTLDGKAI